MSAAELPTPQPIREPLLEVVGLSKSFTLGGRSLLHRDSTVLKAVDNVSFTIWPGETLALVGESGSGKTTCARTVARLYRPDAGTIRFKGTDISRLSARALRPLRRAFQMMFQDPFDSLDPRQRVGAIIGEPLVIHGWKDAAARRDRIAEVMRWVGLNPADDMRYPHEFSGGQRQRIALARTLVLEPELIIADEPLSALDVSIQSQILNLLADLQERLGFACLFITHDLAVVDAIADRVAVMKSGRIVEEASRQELFANPRDAYTRTLLQAVPQMGRGKRRMRAAANAVGSGKRHAMMRFIAARLVQSVIVLLVMSFVVYLLIGLMPGDPVDLMIAADPKLTSADIARLKVVYGLDQPLFDRYLAWLGAALTGDFGNSRLHVRPVLEVMGPFLSNTVVLMGASFVLSIVIAIPAGVYAALRPHSKTDHIINLLCFAGISVPVFWLALMLMMVFSVWLGILPASGIATVGDGSLGDRLVHLILPTLTLTVFSVGHYTRYVRAAMMETMRQDFIRTARAKGAAGRRILWRHALPNALIPVVTIVALSFGSLFSGALVTETMFAYPGMGKIIYDAIMGNDYNLALIGLLFATLLTLAGNLLADIAYAWLDPRISYGGGEARA